MKTTSLVLRLLQYVCYQLESTCAALRIIIGKNVSVRANTTIVDKDFQPLKSEHRRSHPQEADRAPLYIEDNVFVGMTCLILKGVKIGHGCVMGVGSVVTKDMHLVVSIPGILPG